MNKYRIFILLLSVLTLASSFAQKKKAKAKAKPKVQVQELSPAQKLYQTMLSATAKVMFIDSVVVDKDNFLAHIPLVPEMGTLTAYNKFFKTQKGKDGSVYEDELKNTRYFSLGDSIEQKGIYTSDRLGHEWSAPRFISELGNEYQEPNYPFLMPDGSTMYFAAKGDKSIGGYDIFITKKNFDSNQFYQPENYGLPFNSTANDYLIVFDEINSLGWLVSDRYQTEGKVCIYTFVPTSQRQGFEADNLSNEQVKSYADIRSIKDTWGFGDRDKAMVRLAGLLQGNKSKTSLQSFRFEINDEIVYTNTAQFKSPQSRQLLVQLQELEKEFSAINNDLDKKRQAYKSGNKNLRSAILQQEEKVEKLRVNIMNLQKEIRNIENK